MRVRGPWLKHGVHVLCAGWLLCVGSGCRSTIVLGDECPPGQMCSDSETGDGDGDRQQGDGDADRADSGSDPQRDGATPSDAGSTLDAALNDASIVLPVLDAGPGTPAPALRNPSFERVTGTGPGDLNGLAFRALDPWYVCLAPAQLNFVRVDESIENGNYVVNPTQGRYFVGFSYTYVVGLTVPIAQELATPLKAGQRYAFLVDVRSEAGGGEQLGLIVKGGTNLTPCAFLTNLAETDYLASNQWTTECITFTPDSDFTQLAFMPKNKNGIAVTNRFFIDNIRTDPSCQ